MYRRASIKLKNRTRDAHHVLTTGCFSYLWSPVLPTPTTCQLFTKPADRNQRCIKPPLLPQKNNFQEPFFSKGIYGHKRKGSMREQLGPSTVLHPTKEHCCFSFLVTKFYPILLGSHGLQPARLLFQWNLPGKNTGVGCHALLLGIFPTQGLFLFSLIACRFFTNWAHLNNKQNKNTNPIISKQDYHFTQPCPSEEKQTNKQTKNSAQSHPLGSLHKPLDQSLEGRNQKEERIQPWSLQDFFSGDENVLNLIVVMWLY